MTRIANPASIASRLNAGKTVKTIPTFTHEVGGIVFEDVPVVIRCAQSGRWNVVARVNEDGVYVKDNTFVGNDKTAKATGLYRIDKQADKENQVAWRARQKELRDAGEAAINGEVEDAA